MAAVYRAWDRESGVATVNVRIRNAPLHERVQGRLGGDLQDPAVARAYAEEAARTNARAEVLRKLKGQHVTSTTTVQNLMIADQSVRTAVEGWLDRITFDSPRWDENVARVNGRLVLDRAEFNRLAER